jgi:hypothetical protein
MTEPTKKLALDLPLDSFVLVSHLALALVASLAFEAVADLPLWVRAVMVAVYLIGAYAVYIRVKLRAKTKVQTDIDVWKQHLQGEIEKWKRIELLQRRMLGISAEFLKERYQVIHGLVSDLERLKVSPELSTKAIAQAFEDFDKERRSQIKRALELLSSFWTEDVYLRPDAPEEATTDFFKVTFYAVETAEVDGVLGPYLVPKARAIPNEGEPRTQHFKKGEGASGRAWATKKVVVCELGGKDPLFEDKWPGGGQKAGYKSMICIPAIEDIPSERMSEVYGVLSIDTPVREGYFQANLEQFWGALNQPICNLLIYCRESERFKTALVEVVKLLVPNADGRPETLADRNTSANDAAEASVPAIDCDSGIVA